MEKTHRRSLKKGTGEKEHGTSAGIGEEKKINLKNPKYELESNRKL
jgi:hypothetical protein